MLDIQMKSSSISFAYHSGYNFVRNVCTPLVLYHTISKYFKSNGVKEQGARRGAGGYAQQQKDNEWKSVRKQKID